MLPGLIAARIIFSKLSAPTGQAAARPYVRRAYTNRSSIDRSIHHQSIGGSRRFASSTVRGRRCVPVVDSTTSASSQSESDHDDQKSIDNGPKKSIIDSGSKKSILDDGSKKSIIDNAKSTKEEEIKWIPIYRFNLIGLFGTISRLKIIQTAIVVGMIPLSIYLYQNDQVSSEVLLMNGGFGLFALIMLYLISGLLRRCIGVISVHPNRKDIRIGYLTFWGWRRNLIVPIEDLVPLEEANSSLGSKVLPPYVQVKKYTDEKFYLHLPLYKMSIVDEELFRGVFGDVQRLQVKKSK